MVIYECDMCGQQFPHESYVHDVIAHEKASEEPFGDGTVKFNVCHDCSRLIGEFIRGHKSRMKGFRCTIDTTFGNNESAGVK